MAADDVDREVLEWRVRGAEGEWYERHTVSQDLPRLATDVLVAGWDTPSLRVLAGEPPNAYVFDLGDLFARALVDEWEGQWHRERSEVGSELRQAMRDLLERPLPDRLGNGHKPPSPREV